MRALRGVDQILLLSRQETLEHEISFQFLQLIAFIGSFIIFIFGFRIRGKRDLEIELGQEGAREVGVLVTAFQDDAVEFSICDCNWEVRFCFTTRGETGEKLSVKEGDPCCLRGGSPV
jgi:hypothetical protein